MLWPYVSYFFWMDAMSLIKSEKAHSTVILGLFMFANAGLSILQIVWLREIIVTAKAVLFGNGDLSIDRGGPKESEAKKKKTT